jgi:cell shape-determining protein MreC
MKSIKVALPWLLTVLALVGVYVTYNSSKAKGTELAALQQEVQELQKLKAEIAELKNAQVSKDEVERLRKDSLDLPRLRGEVRKLRDENQLLTKQVQTAPRVDPQQQQQVQQLQTEVQQLRNQSQQLQQTTAQQAQINGCVNNLRQIDGAKQQWALENRKTATALVNQAELLRYLKDNAMPVCPGGGAYTLNTVGLVPTCNIPGHVIPK